MLVHKKASIVIFKKSLTMRECRFMADHTKVVLRYTNILHGNVNSKGQWARFEK